MRFHECGVSPIRPPTCAIFEPMQYPLILVQLLLIAAVLFLPVHALAQADDRCDSLFFALIREYEEGALRTAAMDAYRVGTKTGDDALMAAAYVAWMHSYHLQFEEAPVGEWDFDQDLTDCGSAMTWKQGVQAYFQGDQAEAMRLFDLTGIQSTDDKLRKQMILNMAGLSAIMGNPILALDRLTEFLTLVPSEMPIPALAGLLVVEMQTGTLNELFDMAEQRFFDESLDIRQELILGSALLASFTLHEALDRADNVFEKLQPKITANNLKLNAFQVLNFYLLTRDKAEEWRAMRPQLLEWRMKNANLPLHDFASVHLLWGLADVESNFDQTWSTARDLVSLDMSNRAEEREIFRSVLNREVEEGRPFRAVQVLSPWKSSWAFVLVGLVLGAFGGALVMAWFRKRRGRSGPDEVHGQNGWSANEIHNLGRLRRYLESNSPDKFGLILLDQFQNQRKAEVMECVHQHFPEFELSTTFQEVLSLSVQGFSGKEIAQVLDVTQGHVYNTRTQLKASFGMGEVDFPQWYKNLSGRAGGTS